MKSHTLSISFLLALSFPLQTLAHFKLTYPAWRGNSLSETNTSISQWNYPCANLDSSSQRTPWPLTGGSILLDLHHPWTYLFVNLGFGSEVTNFNVSLNPDGGRLVNETGNGTFCWQTVPLPGLEMLGVDVKEGMQASIQVVTVGDSGSALYNVSEFRCSSSPVLDSFRGQSYTSRPGACGPSQDHLRPSFEISEKSRHADGLPAPLMICLLTPPI